MGILDSSIQRSLQRIPPSRRGCLYIGTDALYPLRPKKRTKNSERLFRAWHLSLLDLSHVPNVAMDCGSCNVGVTTDVLSCSTNNPVSMFDTMILPDGKNGYTFPKTAAKMESLEMCK